MRKMRIHGMEHLKKKDIYCVSGNSNSKHYFDISVYLISYYFLSFSLSHILPLSNTRGVYWQVKQTECGKHWSAISYGILKKKVLGTEHTL
jgi:hypothetical protein